MLCLPLTTTPAEGSVFDFAVAISSTQVSPPERVSTLGIQTEDFGDKFSGKTLHPISVPVERTG
jgi:hypothetical protein